MDNSMLISRFSVLHWSAYASSTQKKDSAGTMTLHVNTIFSFSLSTIMLQIYQHATNNVYI